MPPGHEARNVLLVRLGAVGDVVRALPVLHAMKASTPRRRVGWLVEEASASLLAEQPLDAVHVLPRRALSRALRRPTHWPAALGSLAALRRELRARRYDLVLDLHGTLKASIAARLAGTVVIGAAPPGSKEGASRLYDRVLPFPARQPTRVERALLIALEAGLVEATGATGRPGLTDGPADGLADGPDGPDGPANGPDGPADGPDGPDGAEATLETSLERARRLARDARFGLVPSPRRVAGIAAWCKARGTPLVALVPFASRRGHAKRWPLLQHVELGRRLAADGASVVLAWGSPAEREEAVGALAACAAPAPELLPPTDLVELTEVLRRADVVVTGDTGPMHLAAGVGTPTVALFGPSDPVINRPWGCDHRVLVRQPLEDLGVDEVLAATRDVLEASLPCAG